MLRDDLQQSAARLLQLRKTRNRDQNQDRTQQEKPHIWALKDVSVEIPEGSSTGIIGSNGAGKTTLLKILAHITVPSKGKVRLRGRVGSLLEVGTGFHPELTGRENIYLNGSILSMRKREIDRKFDEIVSFSEIDQYLDTPVKFYSSGMTVRLAFSVAAHLNPEILLLDEVLAVGDINFQKKSLNKMSEVAQSGRTVLFVSHNLAAVRALCKQGIFLEHGELKYFGDVNSAIESYLGSGETQKSQQVVRNVKEHLNLQILSIAIQDKTDKYVSRIPQDQPFMVNFQVDVRKSAHQFFPCMEILDTDLDTLICSNHFNDDESEGIRSYQPGTYTFQVKVPAPLLVPGNYRINIRLLRKGKKINRISDQVEHVCPFEIYDHGSMLARFGVKWSGKLAADLEWTCSQDEN